MLYDILRKALDIRSGKLLNTDTQNENYWKTVFDVEWKGNLHFSVVMSEFNRGLGQYYVTRDGQLISPTYTFSKADDTLFRKMQRLIDDVENGKFSNKKTMKEKISSYVEKKGLVSYMNNTKWCELFEDLNKNMKHIEIQYKTIFDEKAPDEYWELYGDEELRYISFAQLHWLKMKHVITQYRHIGALLPPEVESFDKKDELLQILRKYNIPYEYDENEQAFIIIGYK